MTLYGPGLVTSTGSIAIDTPKGPIFNLNGVHVLMHPSTEKVLHTDFLDAINSKPEHLDTEEILDYTGVLKIYHAESGGKLAKVIHNIAEMIEIQKRKISFIIRGSTRKRPLLKSMS